MELILNKDVQNLGFKDDIVTVKNGYGRNYLIPQGFAHLATASAKKVLAENLKQRAHKEAKIVAQAHEEAKRLKEKANQDIALSKVEALSSVKGDVADLTVMLAEKIMATTLDKEAQSDLIDSYLDKLGDA